MTPRRTLSPPMPDHTFHTTVTSLPFFPIAPADHWTRSGSGGVLPFQIKPYPGKLESFSATPVLGSQPLQAWVTWGFNRVSSPERFLSPSTIFSQASNRRPRKDLPVSILTSGLEPFRQSHTQGFIVFSRASNSDPEFSCFLMRRNSPRLPSDRATGKLWVRNC